jgi:hypothetical protein
MDSDDVLGKATCDDLIGAFEYEYSDMFWSGSCLSDSIDRCACGLKWFVR